jgi:hypothetical protein
VLEQVAKGILGGVVSQVLRVFDLQEVAGELVE